MLKQVKVKIPNKKEKTQKEMGKKIKEKQKTAAQKNCY